MKFIFVFDGLQFGGIERVGIEYIKLLINSGHDIKTINLRPDWVDLESELPKNVDILHIPFPRNLASQRYSKLIKLMPGGIALFYICAIPLNIVRKLYAGWYKKKIPSTDVVIAFSGHYNDLTFVSENFKGVKKIAWLHGDESSYNDIAPGYFALYKEIKNLVCLSERNDKKCEAFNNKNQINKVLIYNPINLSERKTDEIKVENLKLKYKDFILMVGRMAKDKDQETLIRSLKILREKFNLQKNLILVGDGPERKRLEELVQKMQLDQQIFFVGAQYDVQNYYAAARVYAHSSPAEGLPTVLLEAMYYKLPIAATNSEPGVREILKENCGLVTEVGDAEALARSIYELYTNEALEKELVLNSSNRIKDFMPSSVMDKFKMYIDTLQ